MRYRDAISDGFEWLSTPNGELSNSELLKRVSIHAAGTAVAYRVGGWAPERTLLATVAGLLMLAAFILLCYRGPEAINRLTVWLETRGYDAEQEGE